MNISRLARRAGVPTSTRDELASRIGPFVELARRARAASAARSGQLVG